MVILLPCTASLPRGAFSNTCVGFKYVTAPNVPRPATTAIGSPMRVARTMKLWRPATRTARSISVRREAVHPPSPASMTLLTARPIRFPSWEF